MKQFRPYSLLILGIALLVLFGADSTSTSAAPVAQTNACQFQLGFAALRAALPDRVGDCLDNEQFNATNGNAEQHTTAWHRNGGLLVWRKADNWTAFTDGGTTWINGPSGIQSRPNAGPCFAWESCRTSTSEPPSTRTGTPVLTAPLLRPIDLSIPEKYRTGRLATPRQLNVPPGFSASVFASGLPGARFMALGSDGTVYVTGISSGRVLALPDRDRDGIADSVDTWAQGLSAPHGITIHDNHLYVGEQNQIVRFTMGSAGQRTSEAQVVVPGLPAGGGHRTRTVGFGPNGKMYVAVGSSCNVCEETDDRRAAVSVYDADGSAGRIFSRGLRNAVGFVWRPGTTEIWASNNGRDNLGDDIPPEAIYQLRDGAHFGWPYCNAPNVPDPQFGRPEFCKTIDTPAAMFQAHSAPLGLRFYDGNSFPNTYRGDLFVALHGSWNRSSPVGYKIIRIPFNGGSTPGTPEDFATGWLPADNTRANVWARPVDLLVTPDGALLVSDDDGGTIYRIAYTGGA